MKQIPIQTLLILLIAIALFVYPAAFDALVYHRHKIMSGEWGRMLTGHAIHGSLEHVIRDGASFLFFGSLLEPRLGVLYLPTLLFSALTISLGYLIFREDVILYCGLSGVITGICGYILMQELPRTWKARSKLLFAFYSFLTVGLVFKIGYEFFSGQSFFYREADMNSATEAHFLGLVSGVFAWWVQGSIQKNRDLPAIPRPCIYLSIIGGAVWTAMVLFW